MRGKIDTGAYPAFIVDYSSPDPMPAGERKYDFDVCTPNGLVRIEGVGAIGDFWPDPIMTLPLTKERPVTVLNVNGEWHLSAVERPDFAECEGNGQSSKASIIRAILTMSSPERAAIRGALNLG